MITLDDKIREIDRLIVDEKRMTGRRNGILAAVAADLRARQAGAGSAAIKAIERRIESVDRALDEGRDRTGPVFGVGEEVIGRWSVLRQALELLAEVDQDEEQDR